MKFSWQILNYLINLKKISFDTFEEKLTLAGLEIEKIEHKDKILDKIINLNITANRRDIYSIANLAKEISAIFNIPLEIKYKEYSIYKRKNNLLEKSNNILYCKLNVINNMIHNTSPRWLKNHLIAYEIESKNILNDIKKYIHIKWGQKIFISNELTKKSFENLLIKTNNKNNQTSNAIIIYFPVYNYQIENNIQNYTDNFFHAYNETIRIITSFTKGTISKSKEFFNKELNNKIESIKTNQIKIHKNIVQKTLGPINKKKIQFLSKQQIFLILNQLQLKPLYINQYKLFLITIPKTRIHDLKRQIDIIEEVGRIHGFKNFLNKLPEKNKKGNITKKLFNINKITYILRNIGFNEVINSSLKRNTSNKYLNIKLHNPITEEQKQLRNNIIEGLIENYQYNIKQKNSSITIFEIGKIFYKTDNLQYKEEIKLGGLIHYTNNVRDNWKERKKNFNWFHAKGIMELFFEKLKIQTKWKQLTKKEKKYYIKPNITSLIHPIKYIGIYSSLNDKYIGILSELNRKYKYNTITYYKPLYFFEINLKQLSQCIKNTQHLTYITKPYSLYPCITRDINIQLNQHENFNDIKTKFIDNKEYLIESVELISEYYNSISQKRSICLRLTYRSNNRTLNSKDIEKNIKKYLKIKE